MFVLTSNQARGGTINKSASESRLSRDLATMTRVKIGKLGDVQVTTTLTRPKLHANTRHVGNVEVNLSCDHCSMRGRHSMCCVVLGANQDAIAHYNMEW